LETLARALWSLDRLEIVSLTLTLGILVFAVTTAIALLRTRSRGEARLAMAKNEIARLRDEADRATTLLLAEPQVVVVWREADRDPLILGDAANFAGVEAARRVLAFGTWLGVEEAHALDQAVEGLRQRGEAFVLQLVTPRGRHLEADGRPIGASAVLRLRETTGARLEYAALGDRLRRFEREIEHIRALLEAVPAPVWLHDAEGRLAFANQAYASAVEAADAKDAIERGLELLDQSAREEALHEQSIQQTITGRDRRLAACSRRD
jgi:PAS domain-containing protein